MKNVLILVFLITFNSSLKAQTVEWTNALVDCMYSGYDNVLPLKFVSVDTNKVKLEVSDGEIKRNKNGHYIWYSMTSTGTEQILTIKADGKIIGEYKMKFVRIPDPTVELLPSKATVKTMTGIKGVFSGVKMDIPITVQSYDIQITKNGEITTLQVKGANLTKSQRSQLKYVKSDSQVLINNVFVKCPGDKAARRVGDLQLQ